MSKVKAIFWSAREHRLRAGWRILLQFALFVAVSFCFGLIFQASGKTMTGAVLAGSFYLAVGLGTWWLLARFIDHRSFADYGFHFSRNWWMDFAFGLALGALIISGIFIVEWLAGWISVRASPDSGSPLVMGEVLLVSLLVYAAVGINEELTFRGYELRNLAEGLAGRWIGHASAVVLALCASATAFGLLHWKNQSASAVTTANIVLGGLAFGLPYVLTGELAMSIGLHISWNFCEGTIYGFFVSGHEPIRPMILIEQGGPVRWTGGKFGPEGGLLAVLAIALSVMLGLLWIAWRNRHLRVRVELAVYNPRPLTSHVTELEVPRMPASSESSA
jgi:membrane protease YdiL (CAAX protease family)